MILVHFHFDLFTMVPFPQISCCASYVIKSARRSQALDHVYTVTDFQLFQALDVENIARRIFSSTLSADFPFIEELHNWPGKKFVKIFVFRAHVGYQ